MPKLMQLACTCSKRLLQTRAHSGTALPQDLSRFLPQLDVAPENYLETGGEQRVYIYNDPPIFQDHPGPPPHAFLDTGAPPSVHSAIAANSPFGSQAVRDFYKFALVVHRVATMTSKGKVASMYALVVAGNGKGLVGWGQAKHEMLPRAVDKAFTQAVRNFGVVERYEDRTVWGNLQGKFGATSIDMWSRPPGFGLRTSHLINQVARAAGIRDLSAKVRGSRNAMNTVKLAIGMLQNRSRPVAFGDGFGHRGSRKDKIEGMKTATEVAFARGRRAVLV